MDGPILVTGLTVVRNGTRLRYPFLEAIRSVLPICDEYLVVVGDGEDDTLERAEELAAAEPRVRVIRTEWSAKVNPRKCVLAQQTNLGLHQARGTWCVALQANEVLHERDLPRLRALMEKHADDTQVEALLFERLTFLADYRHVIRTYPHRYKWTARIVKPHIGIHSIRDAMSFAVFPGWSTSGRYPRAIDTGVDLFRYGMVMDPEDFERKQREADHRAGDARSGSFAFSLFGHVPLGHVARYEGEHPQVMAELVAATPERFAPDAPGVRPRGNLRDFGRAVETALYSRFGMPSWRPDRYRLIGGYVAKARDEY